MTDVVFHEIAWLLIGATAVGLIGAMLRQPVIVSFIAVGIAAAAVFDSSTETASQVSFLAELGVAILLFLVGLKLDWRLVRTLGPVAHVHLAGKFRCSRCGSKAIKLRIHPPTATDLRTGERV